MNTNTANTMPPVPPKLTLSYSSHGQYSSSALLVYQAVKAYRDEKIKWLFKMIADKDEDAALFHFDEVETLDQVLDDLVQNFECAYTSEVKAAGVEEIESDRDRKIRKDNEAGLQERMARFVGR